jgi:3-isopropylmalate/(R)-2-methylmalate dehydratase large subunit
MGMTAVEKILARAGGRKEVRPGDLLWAKVDVVMTHDSSGPRRVEPVLKRLGVGIWDPDRVVLVSDHYAPAINATSAEFLQVAREFASRYGIRSFHDIEGICHTLMIERGHVRPGMLYIGGDSHTPTGGAVGAFSAGVGSTDMVGVLVTGEIWMKVPETTMIEWTGVLGDGVTAKDMSLRVLGDIGPDGAAYQSAQWCGPGVYALSLEERSVLTNMSAELGAKTGFIEPDETVFAHLRSLGRTDYTPVYGDPDAAYSRKLIYDAGSLEPLVARPHAVENVAPVQECAGIPIQQAYVGACTGAKYEDLAMAARILRGRKVAPGVRLLVAPASQWALQRAAADGVLNDLVAAGAIIMAWGCQACAGLGAGILAPGERCISTTNRNFRGRMGSPEAEVYLASPYTVAASAVAGEIVDPRPFLRGE